jgi:elongation factor 1-beta
MGKVIALLKVMPETVEAFDGMKEKVMKEVEFARCEEEPVAFGLKVLKVTVVVEDSEGGIEPIEEKLKSIEGVGEVTVADIGKL